MKHHSACCYVIATLIALPTAAQPVTPAVDGSSVAIPVAHAWSLRECCDYAIEHSIPIKQQENERRQQEIQLSTSRNSRLPDVSASLNQNFSFGRGLTADNTYSNTNTSSTSLQLGASMPLFTGFQIPNQIKLNQLNLESATADLEKARTTSG